jgi:hypothetical protein
MGAYALGIAENESGHKTWKWYLTPSVQPKTSPEAQNMKTGPDASVPPKMSLGAQHKKSGTDALGTTENEARSEKQENGTRRPRYRRKWFSERKTRKRDPTPSEPLKMTAGMQNMKTEPDALVTAGNDSGSAKHENGTRRSRYRQKLVPAHKTWKRDLSPSGSPKSF